MTAALYVALLVLLHAALLVLLVLNRRQKRELALAAHRDPLTGLVSHRILVERLDHALARAQRHTRTVGVLFVDLDRFKIVNDSLGHDRGDRVLEVVAERLRECVRDVDTVARIGGDEFSVLLEEVADTTAAVRVAERILAAIATAYLVDGNHVYLSASVGVAVTEDGDAAGPDLLRNADHAMRSAKQGGRNRYEVFEPHAGAAARSRLALETDLRDAVPDGQLRVVFQPEVLLETGRIVGVEALLRWEHPELGLMPPGSFIPVAEETGLIVDIGRWVLEEACRRVGSMHHLVPLHLAVNVSGRQLEAPDLVESVEEILERTGFPAEMLTLELTESVLMENRAAARTVLHELRALGVGLAIDDFGTGYSSLSYLKDFPVSTIKLDRSFVIGLDDDVDIAIVRSVIGLGASLALHVTAEGVESQEQLSVLRTLGCRNGQGFYFSRPVTDTVLETMLHANRIDHERAWSAAGTRHRTAERAPASVDRPR